MSDGATLVSRTRLAVLDAVQKQREIGLSIVDDGEQGRADYTIYVKDRLTGFAGESSSWPNPDAEEFPDENVIAGVDCGFGTFAGRVQVDTNIVWHKLRVLVEGADLASRALR